MKKQIIEIIDDYGHRPIHATKLIMELIDKKLKHILRECIKMSRVKGLDEDEIFNWAKKELYE